MESIIRREHRIDFLWIFIGTALMAMSTNLFFSSADMVPGGFTGLAIIIRHLTQDITAGGIPLWISNIVLNVPLILFSIRLRGWRFIKRTFFAAILFSVHLYWIPELTVVEGDLVLTSVFGGILMGLGLGFVLLGKATTGGTDTLAALIQAGLPYLSVAKIVPFLDGTIILISVFIFGIRLTLYAVLSVFLAGLVADEITAGTRNAKLAYIISDHHEEIAHSVMNEMDRGATLLKGIGMYTGSSRPVLMVAVSKREIVTLREIAASHDPDAFLILTDATEIRGEGFLRYSHDEL